MGFKVGDVVKVINSTLPYYERIGTVIEADRKKKFKAFDYEVKFGPDIEDRVLFDECELQLWEPGTPPQPETLKAMAYDQITAGARMENMTKAEYQEFVRKTFDDMLALIKRKNQDYCGSGDDPFANFRQAATVGVDPLAGLVVRLLDKVSRVQSFFQNGDLKNESLDDAFLDLIGYSCLALGMLNEKRNNP